MASKKKKQRHLSLTDRTFIEQELVRGSSFTDIGKALGKDPSTIAKEIKLHMETRKASGSAHGCSNCRNYKECTLQHMCGSITCKRKCKSCNLFQHHHNGPEFKNPWDIEKDTSGKRRCYVFYCDPYSSSQKGKLENNHEYIRYVIPKGKSMQGYTQDDINKLASHINSTARDSLNGATPFALAKLLIDKRNPVLTGQFEVSPDDVMLKPDLLNK